MRIVKILVLNLGWFLGSCAPLFSEMQSARLVGKRKLEVTPGYSSVGLRGEGYNDKVAHFMGFQAAYGISENVDLRFRFERVRIKSSNDKDADDHLDFNVVGIGPKINLIRDRVALLLPVGLGGAIMQFQPTFLFTAPVIHNKIDINPSVKHIMNVCLGCWQPLVAFNIGMALSSDLSKWAIRPEYGVLTNLNTTGHFSNFSVGISLNLSTISKP